VHFLSEFSTNALRSLEGFTASLRAGKPTSKGVYHSMSAIDNVFADLERNIVARDDLGISVGSNEELVFRTARMIVSTQLDRIDQAIHSVHMCPSPDPMSADGRSRFLAAIALGKDELRRITRIWLPYRHAEPGATVASDTAAYHEAIRTALSELGKMDEIPEIERMLYRGVASTRCPELASACEQILVAIQVRVDFQAARRLCTARNAWERALGVR